jgi:hypothetical protein
VLLDSIATVPSGRAVTASRSCPVLEAGDQSRIWRTLVFGESRERLHGALVKNLRAFQQIERV